MSMNDNFEWDANAKVDTNYVDIGYRPDGSRKEIAGSHRLHARKRSFKEKSAVYRVTETAPAVDYLKPDQFKCIVEMLDFTESVFILTKKDIGAVLYKRIFHLLDLQEEQAYFGLQFQDGSQKLWLDPQKTVFKQCKVPPGGSCQLRLCVKFFTCDPRALFDEVTRYLYVCHLRREIKEGRLKVDSYDTAVHLAALLLQAELGDYREGEHDSLSITSHPFLPEEEQTSQFENDVFEHFVSLRKRNITPAMADKMYLNVAMRLPDYGVERYPVVAKEDGGVYDLGISANGLVLYRDNTVVGLFSWQNMTTLEFSGKRLRISVKHSENVEADPQPATTQIHLMSFVFLVETKKLCKQLWKSAMEHHCFFRLQEPLKPATRLQRFMRAHTSLQNPLQHTELSLLQSQQMRLSTGSSEARSSFRLQRRSLLLSKSSNSHIFRPNSMGAGYNVQTTTAGRESAAGVMMENGNCDSPTFQQQHQCIDMAVKLTADFTTTDTLTPMPAP